MSRWVRPQHSAATAAAAAPGTAPAPGDDAAARIVKYVPAEIVATFTVVITGMIAATVQPPPEKHQVAVWLIGLFFVGTVVYVWTRTPPGPERKAHLLVSPLAFLAWAYPISSAALGALFVPYIALLLQAVVLLLSILIVPKEP
jgi:hypothetical protein